MNLGLNYSGMKSVVRKSMQKMRIYMLSASHLIVCDEMRHTRCELYKPSPTLCLVSKAITVYFMYLVRWKSMSRCVNASTIDGAYFPASMAIMVCRVAPTRFAKSACVQSVRASRRRRIWFLIWPFLPPTIYFLYSSTMVNRLTISPMNNVPINAKNILDGPSTEIGGAYSGAN